MIIPAHLDVLTVKQLAELAKKRGLRGWQGLRKDELISALKKDARAVARKAAIAKTSSGKTATKTGKTSKPGNDAKTKKNAKPAKKSPREIFPKKSASRVAASQVTKKTTKTKPTVRKTAVSGKKSSAKPESSLTSKKTPLAKPTPLPKKENRGSKASVKSSQPTVAKPSATKVSKMKQAAAVPSKPSVPAQQKSIAETLRENRAALVSSDFLMTGLKDTPTTYRGLGGIFDGEHKDRLALMARDSYWLHAFWELNLKLIERARAAMGVHWHTAAAILRLNKIVSDGISKQRRVHVRDIRLQGNVNNWYIDVQGPSAGFFVEIGYLSAKGRFFPLASSNTVETPENHGHGDSVQPGSHWGDLSPESERGFKHNGASGNDGRELNETFEERHKRPIPTTMIARFGNEPLETVRVDLEADVVIYGRTQPDVQLTIKNEPIRLQPDGRFSVRFHLPEKRQVYPVVAVSSDGIESQTTILAIERNTKALETVYREHDELD